MILAIDLGSTSFKAGVFNRRLRQLRTGSAPLRYRYGAGGRVELEVPIVERALRFAIRQARPEKISIIAITSQAQTFTILDRHGRASRPFVSWQDGRAGSAAVALRRSLKHFAEHSSFAEVLAPLQICQLKQHPVGQGDSVLHLPAYCVQLLTGENVVDDNLAAMSGLYSLAEGGWWPAALRACGLRPDQLSRILPIGSVGAPTTAAAARFGLPAGVPVVLAGNDQTAGAYAARLEEDNGLLLTIGSAQVVYACRSRIPRPAAGLIRGPYPGGRGYRMAADSAGGNIVNWAKTILAGCGTDETFFQRAARASADSRGLRFELSELADRATWDGIAMHHTAGDLARAVVECLSARLAGLVGDLGGNLAARKVLVAGGGSEEPFWVRTVAQHLRVPLRVTPARPILGAARMASAHLGPAAIPR